MENGMGDGALKCVPESMKVISRRELLRQTTAAIAVGGLGRFALGNSLTQNAPATVDKSKKFPDKFLWGCATAGYQVEGNNTNSEIWMLEHLPGTLFKEPSGDACDHYHLYRQDIAMLADLGFNTYRFSLEWSRIEPEEGFFSNAEMDHYRRMLDSCHEHSLTPMLTYSHFSLPRWFAMKGGWEYENAPDLYARFCEKATRHVGDLVGYASTLNEPDLPQLLNWVELPGVPFGISFARAMLATRGKVRKQVDSRSFSNLLFSDGKRVRDGLLAAHAKGRDAMKSVRPEMPVGFNLAISDDQPAPEDSHLAEKRADVYAPWLEAAKHCDYLGVQVYSRSIVGKRDLPTAKDAEHTQTGMEFYPECVEHVVRFAAKETGVPIFVTENGIATEDDTRRVAYIQRALEGLKRAIDDGVDVRGYVAWSLIDNFEWTWGYTPKFGIVAVDLKTQKRTIKPSATLLGDIARRNAL
jgi:beta-glucosidase